MLQTLVGPVSDILDKFIEDKDQKAFLAHEIATMSERHAHELALAQIDVNRAEAESASLFKGGWRPTVGWICATAFGYHFVFQPLIIFVMVSLGEPVPELPEFDMFALLNVLGGMLGIGALRTYEKQKGLTQ